MDNVQETISWLRMGLPTPDPEKSTQLQRRFINRHVLSSYEHAAEEPEFATPRLSKWFRSQKQLGSKDRRRVSDIVYDLIRHQRVLNRFGAQSPQDMIDAWIAFHEGQSFSTKHESNVQDYADALGLPIQIAQQWMKRWTKKECADLAQSINQRPPTYLRLNPLKGNQSEIIEDLKKEGVSATFIPSLSGALKMTQRGNVVGSKAYRQGKIEIQDISSQRFCQAVSAKPGMVVWDLCAGAGGKSLALAANGATVHATDPRSHAIRELKKRATRAGVQIQFTPPRYVDLIVIDAPCSGIGRLHREPALRWRLSGLAGFKHLKTQQELIDKAIGKIKPGGRIAYATCSLLEQENSHPISGDTTEEKWIWPHQSNGDGFYWRIVQV